VKKKKQSLKAGSMTNDRAVAVEANRRRGETTPSTTPRRNVDETTDNRTQRTYPVPAQLDRPWEADTRLDGNGETAAIPCRTGAWVAPQRLHLNSAVSVPWRGRHVARSASVPFVVASKSHTRQVGPRQGPVSAYWKVELSAQTRQHGVDFELETTGLVNTALSQGGTTVGIRLYLA